MVEEKNSTTPVEDGQAPQKQRRCIDCMEYKANYKGSGEPCFAEETDTPELFLCEAWRPVENKKSEPESKEESKAEPVPAFKPEPEPEPEPAPNTKSLQNEGPPPKKRRGRKTNAEREAIRKAQEAARTKEETKVQVEFEPEAALKETLMGAEQEIKEGKGIPQEEVMSAANNKVLKNDDLLVQVVALTKKVEELSARVEQSILLNSLISEISKKADELNTLLKTVLIIKE